MNKIQSRATRKRRVKARIFGTAKCPRLSVFRSLKGIYAQVIDDEKGKTLASSSTGEVKGKSNNIQAAEKVGKNIADKCAKLKIVSVVFDRNGYKYHGKVKAVADGAREGGLKF